MLPDALTRLLLSCSLVHPLEQHWPLILLLLFLLLLPLISCIERWSCPDQPQRPSIQQIRIDRCGRHGHTGTQLETKQSATTNILFYKRPTDRHLQLWGIWFAQCCSSRTRIHSCWWFFCGGAESAVILKGIMEATSTHSIDPGPINNLSHSRG